MPDEPRTVYEEQDGVLSGGAGTVRAAAYSVAGATRGAVTLSVAVPDGFWQAVDGGVRATLLLNPAEARGFAAWLDEAADAADRVGPPLYDAG